MLLYPVQCTVRLLIELLVVTSLRQCHTNTEGNSCGVFCRLLQDFVDVKQFVFYGISLLRCDLRQDSGKFVSADAEYIIASTQVLLDGLRNADQYLIAACVTIGIIDVFEFIPLAESNPFLNPFV